MRDYSERMRRTSIARNMMISIKHYGGMKWNGNGEGPKCWKEGQEGYPRILAIAHRFMARCRSELKDGQR